LSVALNGFLLLAISLAYWKPQWFGLSAPATVSSVSAPAAVNDPANAMDDRQSLPYEKWLDILKQEAKAIAQKHPEHLTVLLGDSLTLWFPPELLPDDRQWLNQGISGEDAAGLLQRLNLLDGVKPQTIFVLVGVNDLIKGSSDTQLLGRYQKMIADLKAKQPKAEIVMQSILPHGGDRLTVDNRAEVLQVSNERIAQVNRQLRKLTEQEGVKFLNLAPVVTDRDGLLRAELSTDGLHLNQQGYAVWQAALQTFAQLALKPLIGSTDAPVDAAPPEIREALPDAPGSGTTPANPTPANDVAPAAGQ
jgi:lysophospholipase L1-like esterase